MANYGVAFWFVVLSLCPAICHEHADGDTDHSHGYGFFSPSPLLVSNGSPEADLCPQSRHYHMVLFGIEITILPGCAALETGIMPAQCDSAITLSADLGVGLIAEKPTQDVALVISPQDGLVMPCSIFQDSCPLVDLSTIPCAPARALRSGTQQI